MYSEIERESEREREREREREKEGGGELQNDRRLNHVKLCALFGSHRTQSKEEK